MKFLNFGFPVVSLHAQKSAPWDVCVSLREVRSLSETEIPGGKWSVGAELRFGGEWIDVDESHRSGGRKGLFRNSVH